MRCFDIRFMMAGVVLLAISAAMQDRGFGGFKGGGARGGSYRGGAVVGPYGGGGYGSKSNRTVVGPVGAAQVGTKSGSYVTPKGSTINYGGAGGRAVTPGGAKVGGGVGGAQITSPNGHTYTKVGTKGGAVGPGGIAVGGSKKVAVGTGPGGGVVKAGHGGAAVGTYGGIGYKGGVAIGPGGGVAASKTTVAAGRYGTHYVSSTALRTQGTYVRKSFHHYNAFTPAWYTRYPGAWFAGGWVAGRAWTVATWPRLYPYCGLPVVPVYYDYGTTVVYQDNTVYVNGTPAPAAEYADQALQIADAGRQAKAAPKEDWEPLGVFALVQGEEKTSYKVFQLAINKAGVVRGNYYDALADHTLPVYGSVDKKTQRAAWSIGEKKDVVYEAGIANLTQDELPILVHFGADSTQQFTLVRIENREQKGGK
jgi:hypothetical protein